MSIIDKLKLEKYTNLVVINQPSDYNIFTNYPTKPTGDHDAIFIFIENIEEMKMYASEVNEKQLLLENGYLFFAYPKKGNKRYSTYIHRDEIFPALRVGEDGYIDKSNLKFSRMVSMDDVFTVVGIKHEKKRQKDGKKSIPASQCVADYEDQVKDVEALLSQHPEQLSFYQGLTPGYQRDWARFIFSAKQEKTRANRTEQMVEILGQGYKSIDLYRQKK